MWTGLYQSLCSRFISLCSLIVSIFRKTPTSARKPFSAVSISLSTSILSLSLSLLLTRYCSHTFSLISCTLRLSLFVAFSFHLPQILPTYKTSSLSLSPFSLSRQTQLERHSLDQSRLDQITPQHFCRRPETNVRKQDVDLHRQDVWHGRDRSQWPLHQLDGRQGKFHLWR